MESKRASAWNSNRAGAPTRHIWLNEGFASWMEERLLDDWKPEWGGAMAKVDRRAAVMGTDSLISARRVRQPIENEGDIRTAFDGITYQKGASLLATYEEWLGRDFLDQAGAPVVSVELRCAAGSPPVLHLVQKRFLPLGSPGAPTAQTWQIPARVRYAVDGKERRARTLLTAAQGELPLTDASGCPEWVQANDSGLGYFSGRRPRRAARQAARRRRAASAMRRRSIARSPRSFPCAAYRSAQAASLASFLAADGGAAVAAGGRGSHPVRRRY